MDRSIHESVADALLLVLETNRGESSISNLINDLRSFVSAPSKLPVNTKRSLDWLIDAAKPADKRPFSAPQLRKAYY